MLPAFVYSKNPQRYSRAKILALKNFSERYPAPKGFGSTEPCSGEAVWGRAMLLTLAQFFSRKAAKKRKNEGLHR
jgi:hypothetical protein